jgi:predicted dehydrogenase
MSAEKVAVGVVGVGYLGKYHAEKYAASSKARLVAVVDTDQRRVGEVAERVGTQALTDYRHLFGRVQCVSVAVPTRLHHRVARDFIEAGIDVLVEKPIAANLDQGRDLVDIAQSKGVIFQVGHLERFNPAIRRLEGVVREPKFVECHRLAPFVERGTDVDVVFDLMIHDIDVIAAWCAPRSSASKRSGSVLTDKPDMPTRASILPTVASPT